MELRDYFENTKGTGVFATADATGDVDAAIYARPHAMEDGSLGFIMAERRSYANIQSNPRAVYLFQEEGPGYRGKRLHLTKVGEETDTERLQKLRRRKYSPDEESGIGPLHLVFFRVEEERPLVGEFARD